MDQNSQKLHKKGVKIEKLWKNGTKLAKQNGTKSANLQKS